MSEITDDHDGNIEENSKTPRWLFTLFLVGFILVLVGVAVAVAASLIHGSQVGSGVVIFIGPIPIVFGGGPGYTWLVWTGIILAVISIILFVVVWRKFERS